MNRTPVVIAHALVVKLILAEVLPVATLKNQRKKNGSINLLFISCCWYVTQISRAPAYDRSSYS